MSAPPYIQTVPSARARQQSHWDAEMVWIPGGVFLMGSDHHYREEGPAHRVRVDDFAIDRYPVTNARFRRFVEETSYVTFAERAPRASENPRVPADMVYAGSLVFVPPATPTDLRLPLWWQFMRGANWRHPLGPASSLEGRDNHPVVHVTFADAEAFARWEGKALPTEAEWEYAARGGLDGAEYAWGDELTPGGRLMANTWQGDFPWHNRREDGYERTSPVGAFPCNGYGLYDMIGNVWEWTADWYHPREVVTHVRCKVMKGGSHLCAPNYCRRYRPAARLAEAIETSACHVGFRCIARSNQSGPRG
jgi:formylglycine-generating enzyme required for sulfatase activity